MSGYNLRPRKHGASATPSYEFRLKRTTVGITNINELPDMTLAKIFEKLPRKDRLKIEEVCKKWHYVGKNLSWANYRIFYNTGYWNWPKKSVMQVKSLFERCGHHLRHLILWRWPPSTALVFLRLATGVQHLSFWSSKLDDEFLKELAIIAPHLKSLDLNPFKTSATSYELGLMECLKAMTCLEYLSIQSVLFDQNSLVQFPSSLTYLCLYSVINADQILIRVAKDCKEIKGLRLRADMNESAFNAISQMKSLTFLDLPFDIPYDIGYVFEALDELRALAINSLDELLLTTVARYCKKLEHLSIVHVGSPYAISPEEHANVLTFASLPSLCSFSIWIDKYSTQQITEFVSRLFDKQNLQHIYMNTYAFILPNVLFGMLRRCKAIQYIGVNVEQITRPMICQAVDEIDQSDKQLQSEFVEGTHPIVEVQWDGDLPKPYKWLRFISQIPPAAILDKWQYGWLSAGKP
ncbi:F-box domain containing protein [Ditylenchus destructor]|uniref:F-box domain containing protein n=1 Tax=Ditylenchus destructor TaxID=166010 RepID=A0AAD4MV47_9BILA|nr:F-box domain containing protein [Ditylenchus destructor]